VTKKKTKSPTGYVMPTEKQILFQWNVRGLECKLALILRRFAVHADKKNPENDGWCITSPRDLGNYTKETPKAVGEALDSLGEKNAIERVKVESGKKENWSKTRYRLHNDSKLFMDKPKKKAPAKTARGPKGRYEATEAFVKLTDSWRENTPPVKASTEDIA